MNMNVNNGDDRYFRIRTNAFIYFSRDSRTFHSPFLFLNSFIFTIFKFFLFINWASNASFVIECVLIGKDKWSLFQSCYRFQLETKLNVSHIKFEDPLPPICSHPFLTKFF